MYLLNRFRCLGKNTFKYCGFGLFGDKLPNLSTQTIKSIRKRYHSVDSNFSDEWINSMNEQQQEKINFIRNEVNFCHAFVSGKQLDKIFVFSDS